MRKIKTLIISLLAVSTFGLAACGGGEAQTSGSVNNSSSQTNPNVSAISLDKYE